MSRVALEEKLCHQGPPMQRRRLGREGPSPRRRSTERVSGSPGNAMDSALRIGDAVGACGQ